MIRLVVLLFALLFAPPALAGGLDLNTATAEQLEALPGIGPSKAAAIVEYRSANGAFATVDDLDAVPGIGPATIANIKDQVSVGPKVAPATAPAPDASPPTGATAKVNVNTATEEALQALPGIGPSKAAAIVSDRQQNGPYATCDDLARVVGIGPATVAGLRDACTVK